MRLTGDYHTHTPYSHGKNSVLENALAAKRSGLSEIAVTDHGFNHLLYGIKRSALADMRAEVEEAKKLTGLNVLMGMESNLISLDGSTDMKMSDMFAFDIYLMGIHLILKYASLGDAYALMLKNYLAYKRGARPSDKTVAQTTAAYINAVKNNPIDILTHINYKCFCDVAEVAKACADYGTYIEINTKKQHISAEELRIMADCGARFVIDSDAHSADRVGDTAIAESLLAGAGISRDLIDNIDGRTPHLRFAEYKRLHG